MKIILFIFTGLIIYQNCDAQNQFESIVSNYFNLLSVYTDPLNSQEDRETVRDEIYDLFKDGANCTVSNFSRPFGTEEIYLQEQMDNFIIDYPEGYKDKIEKYSEHYDYQKSLATVSVSLDSGQDLYFVVDIILLTKEKVRAKILYISSKKIEYSVENRITELDDIV